VRVSYGWSLPVARVHRIRDLILLAVACLAALTGSACQDEGSVRVRSIQFAGASAVDTARLKAALATRESSLLPWGRRFYFERTRLDADVKRILLFYADRGFPDAQVTDVDIRLNDAKDAVDITVTIDEGAPIVVAAVSFLGFELVPSDHVEQILSQSALGVGKPRDRQEVIATRELALNELRDHGYPDAQVSADETLTASGKSAAITFTAEPGALAYFGAIEIAGNQAVSDRIIERQVTYRPGELYRRSLVQESQRRLYSMALFQFVNIDALDREPEIPELRTRVTVTEGRHQRVNFGVGYGTEDKARTDGQYRHLNFLGGARTAGVHARWSSLDRGIRFTLNQPYLFHPRLSLDAQGQQWYTFTPAYQSIISGVRVTATHQFDEHTFWSLSVSGEENSSSISDDALNDPTLRDDLIALGLNPTTGKQEGRFGTLGLELDHSTTDDLLNATRGYHVNARLEQTGLVLPSTFEHSAAAVDVRHYQPLAVGFVLANRIQGAAIQPAGDDPANVPFAKKYFLGGATSIRGWGRFEVSPLSESGLPIGGNTLLAFSSEVRKSFGRLGGVLFVDGGNVWAKDWAFQVSDLRYAAGVGIRYATPVGPLRFDVGYQLNPIDDLVIDGKPQARRWRMHFSIGQAF